MKLRYNKSRTFKFSSALLSWVLLLYSLIAVVARKDTDYPRRIRGQGASSSQDREISSQSSQISRGLRVVRCHDGVGTLCNPEGGICVGDPGVQQCVCSNGWAGPSCLDDLDECSTMNPCNFDGGYCVNRSPTQGRYACGCDSSKGHWKNSTNTSSFNEYGATECFDVSECDEWPNSPCVANATCSNTVGSYSCQCNDGFTGDGYNSCRSAIADDCSIRDDCPKENSFCDASLVKPLCRCKPGYFAGSLGLACQQENGCQAGNHNCDSNADCQDASPPQFFKCTCRDGFTDAFPGADGTNCLPVNECMDGGGHTCDLSVDVCVDRAPPLKFECVPRTPSPTPPPTSPPDPTPGPAPPPTDAPIALSTRAPVASPPTDAPVAPPPTDAPIALSTRAPVASPPTDAPVAPPPTDAPVAPPPTDAPVAPPPTDAPVVPPPTDAPVAPPPTDAPVVPLPTDAPVAPPTDVPVAPPTDVPVAPPTDAPVVPAPPTDCNGIDLALDPGAGTEVCDGIDNNCDGQIDEGFGLDGDGISGGGQAFDTGPAQGLNAIIALQGVYPSRSRRDLKDSHHANVTDHRTLQGGPAPFLGQITWFAGNFAPRGWALCDGTQMAISSNQALFSLLGTIYGGDGRTTFALPDLRGRTPIHQGTGSGLQYRAIGSKGGGETATFSTNNLPEHQHCDRSASTGAAGLAAPQAIDIMPPFLTLNCIIALQGTAPSRNRRDLQPNPDSSVNQGHRSLLTPYIGGISYVAFDFAPRGWAKCDGQTLPMAQNLDLYGVITTTYGGDGRTTFALPDVRGRVIIHPGTGYSIGQHGGQETASLSASNLPPHDHGKFASSGQGAAIATLPPYLVMPHVITTTGLVPSRSRRGLITDDRNDSRMLLDSEPFLGGVGLFAGSVTPSGFLKCDGNLLATSSDSTLFSLLGTTYGGDGRTTFGIPDLKGRMTMHVGTGAGLSNRALGQNVGRSTLTLSGNEMPSHTHTGDTCSCHGDCVPIECSCGCTR